MKVEEPYWPLYLTVDKVLNIEVLIIMDDYIKKICYIIYRNV